MVSIWRTFILIYSLGKIPGSGSLLCLGIAQLSILRILHGAGNECLLDDRFVPNVLPEHAHADLQGTVPSTDLYVVQLYLQRSGHPWTAGFGVDVGALANLPHRNRYQSQASCAWLRG